MESNNDDKNSAVDLNVGKLLKRLGQDAVLAAEKEEWKSTVFGLLSDWLKVHEEGTCDQFHADCTKKGVVEPHHANVWGGVFREAERWHWVEDTGRVVLGERIDARARKCSVWRSRIYVREHLHAVALTAVAAYAPHADQPEKPRYELRAKGARGRTYPSESALRQDVSAYAACFGKPVAEVKAYIYVPVPIEL